MALHEAVERQFRQEWGEKGIKGECPSSTKSTIDDYYGYNFGAEGYHLNSFLKKKKRVVEFMESINLKEISSKSLYSLRAKINKPKSNTETVELYYKTLDTYAVYAGYKGFGEFWSELNSSKIKTEGN